MLQLNFLGGKKRRIWRKICLPKKMFSLGIFLNENSIAKSFADNTPYGEIAGCWLLTTGC